MHIIATLIPDGCKSVVALQLSYYIAMFMVLVQGIRSDDSDITIHLTCMRLACPISWFDKIRKVQPETRNHLVT